jgi:hypothetical protein
MTIRLKGSHGPQQLVPIVSLLLSSHRLLLSTSFLSHRKSATGLREAASKRTRDPRTAPPPLSVVDSRCTPGSPKPPSPPLPSYEEAQRTPSSAKPRLLIDEDARRTPSSAKPPPSIDEDARRTDVSAKPLPPSEEDARLTPSSAKGGLHCPR